MAKPNLVFEYIPAKSISYGSSRNLDSIKYIVIHYTGNKGDTARGNGLYFKNGNTRQAGAHWFVDQAGRIVLSIKMEKTAWSVGGLFEERSGGGRYYQKCVNSNSVSIELCDLVSGEPSDNMRNAVRDLIKYIQYYCPNAKTIIRHFDVNFKCCPATMIGPNNKSWENFKAYVSSAEPTGKKIKTDHKAIIYKRCDSKSDRLDVVPINDVVWFREDMKNGWSRVATKDAEGYIKNVNLQDKTLSEYPVGTVMCNSCLFSDNDKNSVVICQIMSGEKMSVITQRKKWTEVIYNGRKGWIMAKHISV